MERAILVAQRKQGLGKFREDRVKEQIMQSSTPRKSALETVYVAFTPSGLTDVFVDSWFNQVSRVFRGSNQVNKPELSGNETKDRVLFGRYLETLFWRKMVAVDGKYAKGNLKALKDEINYDVCAPALYTNAVNCIGIVTVNNLAIRLVPVFADDYDWNSRILSVDEFIEVTSWIRELTSWGFQAYDGFNASRNGNLDFMLMTVVEQDAKEAIENEAEAVAESTTTDEAVAPEAGRGRTARFVIASQRAASNVVALYRYFFHNERIKYITDTRLTYSYSDYDETADVVEYMINKMVYDNNVPTWLSIENTEDTKPAPVNTKQVEAEQSATPKE